MKYKRYLGWMIIGILMLTVTLPVIAESASNVLMIDVQGNSTVPAEKVLGEVSNTKIGEPLNSLTVQQDMQAIMSTGYFANVQANTEKFSDGVKLIFEVVENPVFKELQVSGLTKLKPEELKTCFRQKTGEVFNTTFFKEDLSKALKTSQSDKGLYIDVKKVNGPSADGVVELNLVELKIGKIKINGLQKTKEFVVTRELSIKEGDIINVNALKQDLMKIMRLRLFDNVEPKFEKSEIPDALDLIITVTEGSTGSFNIGASYSQDTQEMGGLLTFSEGNLMGLGQSVSVDLNFSEDGNETQFTFTEPWLNDDHTSFSLSLWNSDAELTSTLHSWGKDYISSSTGDWDKYVLDLNRTGISVAFGHPWRDSTARIKFNFEKDEIDKYWKYDSGIDDYEDDGDAYLQDKSNLHGNPTEFWNNSIELQLVKNQLSYLDRNFVDGGYQLSGGYEVAGGYIGGAFDYQKLTLEGKWFHSLASNLVLGTRLQGAYMAGDYPDYEALYLGGMNKLRGYHDRRFHDDETPYLMGSKYLLSNTELRYRLPMNKDLELVAFYDVGQIDNLFDNQETKWDYGIGFRYNIPFLGMIRIDQAWNGDDGSRIVFGMQEIF